MTSVDMPKWTGTGLNPTQRAAGNHGMPRVGESLPQERTRQSVIEYQMISLENTHTSNVPLTEQFAFMYSWLYVYKDTHI